MWMMLLTLACSPLPKHDTFVHTADTATEMVDTPPTKTDTNDSDTEDTHTADTDTPGTDTEHTDTENTDTGPPWWKSEPSVKLGKEPFLTVECGWIHCCGIRESDETVECFEYPFKDGHIASTDVAAGNDVSCAIRTDGSVDCWGWKLGKDFLSEIPVGGAYSQVDVNVSHACVLDQNDGRPTCWGASLSPEYPPPDLELIQVTAGQVDAGLTSTGEIVHWGHTTWVDEIEGTPAGGGFVELTATMGRAHWCALNAEREIKCWGDLDHMAALGLDAIPPGPFQRVATATDFSCGLDMAGEITCWGLVGAEDIEKAIVLLPPAGPHIDLSLMERGGCAVRAKDHRLACWGGCPQPP